MPEYDALFFDLDGTLLDTGAGIMRCAAYALSFFDVTVRDPDELRVFVGPPLSETFLRFGIPEEEVPEAVRRYRELYYTEGKYECEPYPGMEACLQALKDKGYRLFTATSKPEPLAKELLERFHLTSYFEIIAGATYDRSREKKKDVLKWLLSQSHFENPLMIGDTVFDITGAAETGLASIGVAWGFGNADEMKKAGALRIVKDPEELADVL